jgi:hypothetical protein
MARNASNPQGAASLHQAVTTDHDGSIFDNLEFVECEELDVSFRALDW